MFRSSKNSTDSSQTRRHRRAAQCVIEVLENRQLLALPLGVVPPVLVAQVSITVKAKALGPTFTGRAVSAVEAISSGYRERFANCDIYYSSASGADEVHGDIRLKLNNLRAQGMNLGLPTSDEMNDGFGGRVSHFQYGDIDWNQTNHDTHEVHGDIDAKWRDMLAHGQTFLGHPTSDEMNDGFGGRVSHFQYGDIDWNQTNHDTHEVHGDIDAKWRDMLAHGQSFLGHPTSDEMNDGFGGRVSHFQYGDIDWNQTNHDTHVEVGNPAADTAYRPVSGSLFGANGPSYLDVHQGAPRWATAGCWRAWPRWRPGTRRTSGTCSLTLAPPRYNIAPTQRRTVPWSNSTRSASSTAPERPSTSSWTRNCHPGAVITIA